MIKCCSAAEAGFRAPDRYAQHRFCIGAERRIATAAVRR